jgi:hypothetical protein
MIARSSALSKNDPGSLGKNSPFRKIEIYWHHHQFGARQIGSSFLLPWFEGHTERFGLNDTVFGARQRSTRLRRG